MSFVICVATTPQSYAEEQSLIDVGVAGILKVLDTVLYKICINVVIILVNCSSLWDDTSDLPDVEEKLISVLSFLGYSNDQSTLPMWDCPSTQQKANLCS